MHKTKQSRTEQNITEGGREEKPTTSSFYSTGVDEL